MSVEFSDCFGCFYFHDDRVRLDLWEEFQECVDDNSERLWLVHSGDRVLFNDAVLESKDITYDAIERFCAWLNEHLVQKKWADKQLDVWGKIVFLNDLNHDEIVVVLWKHDQFVIKTHDFA